MQSHSYDGEQVIRFQYQRIVTALFKRFLVVLEDLEAEHNTSLGRLHDALPAQYQPFVNLADCLDETKAKSLRKKVLDSGNEALREFDDIVKQFNIDLK